MPFDCFSHTLQTSCMTKEENTMKYPEKSFEHAVVAVDTVIFRVIEKDLQVLLLELDRPEFPNMWAAPGGLVSKNETLEASAERHLAERAGLSDIYVEQLGTFGDPDRDPTGWVVSVAYMALVTPEVKPETTKKYKSIAWHSISALPLLAYDHAKIITMAIERLKAKVTYTNIVFALLPKQFTLTELQDVYETILVQTLDKRNFRKKILSLDWLTDQKKMKSEGAHRPAELYSFKSRSLQTVQVL